MYVFKVRACVVPRVLHFSAFISETEWYMTRFGLANSVLFIKVSSFQGVPLGGGGGGQPSTYADTAVTSYSISSSGHDVEYSLSSPTNTVSPYTHGTKIQQMFSQSDK